MVLLEPARLEVAAIGPALGPDDAPITIVEFSDFQCPYCKRVVPTLHQLHEKYADQVRIVFRHLPLDKIHDRARPAAEASACANQQNGFWAFHDMLFENSPEGSWQKYLLRRPKGDRDTYPQPAHAVESESLQPIATHLSVA